jgi:hypothetical protein
MLRNFFPLCVGTSVVLESRVVLMGEISARQRRAVLVVSRSERAQLNCDPDGVLLQESKGLLVVRDPDHLADLGLRLRAGDFLPGRMYLQNPFDQQLYVDASDAAVDFADERLGLFVRLCQALGVTKIEREEFGQDKSSSSHAVGGSAERHSVEIGATVKTHTDLQVERRLRSRWEFPGGAPDFALASDLLRRCGLQDDDQFSTLVDLRVGSNTLLTYQSELDLYRSARTVLDLGASLRIPAFLKLKSSYSQDLQTSEKFRLRLRLDFRP